MSRDFAFDPPHEGKGQVALPNRRDQPDLRSDEPGFDQQLDDYFDTKLIDSSTKIGPDQRPSSPNSMPYRPKSNPFSDDSTET